MRKIREVEEKIKDLKAKKVAKMAEWRHLSYSSYKRLCAGNELLDLKWELEAEEELLDTLKKIEGNKNETL